MTYEEKLAAAEYIKGRIGGKKPKILIILGSGLDAVAECIKDAVYIPYKDIPGFPSTSVKGHRGRLVCGTIGNNEVLIMQGRFHLYEGCEPSSIAFVIHTFRLLGIEKIIITNAAGSLNEDFKVGDLMIITDHINFSGRNPLEGANDDRISDRFFPVTSAYSVEMIEDFKKIASDLGVIMRQGVYIMVLGPNYETNAEVRFFCKMGADAVGMSTVPEVLAAASCGMKVVGISVLTNMAAGIKGSVLDHDDTLQQAAEAGVKLSKILTEYLKEQR
jgi:inosine/guanosine/xanthosine phosphorylase family protein